MGDLQGGMRKNQQKPQIVLRVLQDCEPRFYRLLIHDLQSPLNLLESHSKASWTAPGILPECFRGA